MKSRLIATLKVGAAASALLLGLAAPAFAEGVAPAAAAVQSTGQAPQGVSVPPLGFTKRVLANGLEVYSARDADTSNVTVQVWYKVGSKDDPAGRSGFAHLFEHLMFKSTTNLPPETFDRLTEDVGGSNNAFTADDTTAYFETVPANHLERMLFAEADRMGSLVVDEPTFVAERDVVKEEYRQRILANPYGRLFGLFVPETIYQDSPYRRPGIGSIEELEASSLEDVRRFHATYYRPDAAYLIVAGNFDQAQLDRWVDQYFGPLKNPTTPIPTNNVVEPEPTGPRNVTYYAPNVPLPAAVVAWPTVKYADADRAALTVLDGILSTGESSRLYRSLVYDKQIAAQIGSTPDFSQQAGNLSALAIMAQGHTAEEGIAALNEEIGKLRDTPVSAAELAEAKNEIVANTLRSRETGGRPRDRPGLLADQHRLGRRRRRRGRPDPGRHRRRHSARRPQIFDAAAPVDDHLPGRRRPEPRLGSEDERGRPREGRRPGPRRSTRGPPARGGAQAPAPAGRRGRTRDADRRRLPPRQWSARPGRPDRRRAAGLGPPQLRRRFVR